MEQYHNDNEDEEANVIFFDKTKTLSKLLIEYKSKGVINYDDFQIALSEYLVLRLKSKEAIKWRYYLLILYNESICKVFTLLSEKQKELINTQMINLCSISSDETIIETKEIKEKYAEILNYKSLRIDFPIRQQLPINIDNEINIKVPIIIQNDNKKGKFIEKPIEIEKFKPIMNESLFSEDDFYFGEKNNYSNYNKEPSDLLSKPQIDHSDNNDIIDNFNKLFDKDSNVFDKSNSESKHNNDSIKTSNYYPQFISPNCLIDDKKVTDLLNSLVIESSKSIHKEDSVFQFKPQLNNYNNSIPFSNKLNQSSKEYNNIQTVGQYSDKQNNNNKNHQFQPQPLNQPIPMKEAIQVNYAQIKPQLPYQAPNYNLNPYQNQNNIFNPINNNNINPFLFINSNPQIEATKIMNNNKQKPIISKEEKKITNLFLEIQQYDSTLSYILTKYKQPNLPLNFILDGLSSSLSMNSKLKAITLYSYFFPFYTDQQKENKLTTIDSLCPELTELPLLKLSLFFTKEKNIKEKGDFIKSFIYCEPTIEANIIIRLMKSNKTIEDYLELYQILLYDRYVIPNDTMELTLTKVAFILYYLMQYIFTFLDEESTLSLNKNMHILLDHYKSYKNKLKVNLSLEQDDNLLKYKGIYVPYIQENEIMEIDLFTQSDIHTSEEILNQINHLFSLKETNQRAAMLDKANFDYVMAQIELYYNKRNKINDNVKLYKQNVIRLERELYMRALDEYKLNMSQTDFDSYEMNKDSKLIFNEFRSLIKKRFETYLFELYPIGSITQLLGSSQSDIDIFLDLSLITKPEYKAKFLFDLSSYLRSITHNNVKEIISLRICVIKLEFKRRKIDLSCLGICPYLHSHLIRTYSLIDARFSILAINVKHFIGKLGIKNSDNNMLYLNSFSWMFLLITFLQDIISPPVLPKLIEKTPSRKYYRQVRYPSFMQSRTFEEFFESIKEEEIRIPVTYDYPNYKEIYQEHIRNYGKNNMSLVELFIKFLEFIAFRFKYDALYVNNSIYGEGFRNISGINHSKDQKFSYFYNTRYKKDKNILIREPFDGNYNPGQSLKDTDAFLRVLRKGYYKVIETGTFETLEDCL